MKKKPKAFFIALWLVIIAVIGCYYVVAAPTESSFSETENRMLAAFPKLSLKTLSSGEFENGLEQYLLDRFLCRDGVISRTNRIKDVLGIATYEEYMAMNKGSVDPLEGDDPSTDIEKILEEMKKDSSSDSRSTDTASSSEVPSSSSSSSSASSSQSSTVSEPETPKEDPPITPKPEADINDFPQTVGCYMEVDGETYTLLDYGRDSALALTAVLNKYAALLPENGKLIFTMVPQSVSGNRFVNSSKNGRMYSTYDELINAFGSDNVYAVDAPEILADAAKRNEYIYFRTDMHWTPLGSFRVYEKMIRLAGKKPVSYENDFSITTEDPFLGTYYRDNPTSYMRDNADYLELLMPMCEPQLRRITGKDTYNVIDFLNMNAKANDRYTVYLGGPAGPWTYAKSENGENENCLVLMDSFGLGFFPCLVGNYKQVHYYDPRYFDASVVGYSVSEMIKNYNIHDIYVVIGDLHSFDSGFILTSANNQLFG